MPPYSASFRTAFVTQELRASAHPGSAHLRALASENWRWLPLAESSASFYEQFEFSYKGFTSMHPGRAALDYAVNRDRERVEAAGCSALLDGGLLGLFRNGELLPLLVEVRPGG